MNSAAWGRRRVVLVVVAGVFCWASAAQAADVPKGLQVSEGESVTGSHEVRVTVPGCLKVVFCDGSKVEGEPSDTGVSGFFDLKNDPDGKYNYASTWSGFFSHKLAVEPVRAGKEGAIMPGPGTVELVEANPVRAVVNYTWGARAYGHTDNPVSPDVRFEQTFVVYAPDRLHQTLAFVGIGEEVKPTFITFVLHTSHVRFAGGVYAKGAKYSIPPPWTSLRDEEDPPVWANRFGKSFLLHVAQPGVVTHGDGTQSRHAMNFLFALQKATGAYFYRGDSWVGYRSSIRIWDEQPTLTKGKRLEWHMLVVANHDITDLEKAKPYVKEYREPGVPRFRKGTAVGNGYDEAMGCYQMEAAEGEVDFDVPVLVHQPVFEIGKWPGNAPGTIRVAGQPRKSGTDYIAHVRDGKLLLQIMEVLPEGTPVVADSAKAALAATAGIAP